MEPILINRCRMDEDVYRKSFARVLRGYSVVLYVGAAVMLICGVLYAVASKFTDLIMPLFFVLLAGAEIYLALTTASRTAKLNVRRLEELRGVTAFDTRVEFCDTEYLGYSEFVDEPNKISYENLKKVKEGDGVILLWTRTRQFLVLDRQRFQMGTEEDFWKLMNEKAPDAVPKNRRV